MKIDLPQSWMKAIGQEFAKDYFKSLEQFVDRQRKDFPEAIYPPEDEVFAALKLTPLDKVKVLLLGQDPYFHKGEAHGLCFSVRPNVALPSSLRNVFKELKSDLGCSIPNNGFLTHWAEQGVLMLNTVLTVRDGQPNSHRGQGWELFTDAVIKAVNKKTSKVVFVLWGNSAKAKKSFIDRPPHAIVEAAHPSGLSASKGFFGSKPFSKINQELQSAGKSAIDWQIPNL
jgi:uracil-DNA glycosylase